MGKNIRLSNAKVPVKFQNKEEILQALCFINNKLALKAWQLIVNIRVNRIV